MADVETPSLSLPERTIVTALKRGLAFFSDPANAAFLAKVYEGLTAGEITEIQTFMAAWNDDRNPRIIQGYPRKGVKMPVWTIVLRNESTQQQYLGDVTYKDVDTGQYYGGEMMAGTFGVGIFTENGDLTLAMYYLAKKCLLRERRYLEANNVKSASFSGTEVQPQPEYLPEYVYLRWLDVNCQYEEMVPLPDEYVQTVGQFEPTVVPGSPDERNVVVSQDGATINPSFGKIPIL